MVSFRDYEFDNQIRRIIKIRKIDGVKHYTYICDRCWCELDRIAKIQKGLALCQECRKATRNTYGRRKYIAEMRGLNVQKDLDNYEYPEEGKVGALYRAGWSIKKIADDMNARERDVIEVLNKLKSRA